MLAVLTLKHATEWSLITIIANPSYHGVALGVALDKDKRVFAGAVVGSAALASMPGS